MLFQFPTKKLLVPYRSKRQVGGEISKGTIGHFEFVRSEVIKTCVWIQNTYAGHTCRYYELDAETFDQDWELMGKLPELTVPIEETTP